MDAISTPSSYSAKNNRPQQHPADTTTSVMSIVLLAFTVLGYLLLIGVHAYAIPRFIAVFNDLDTELPGLTIAIVTTPGNIAFIGYIVFVLALIAKEFVPFIEGRIKLILNAIALLMGLLIFAIYVFGLFMPMVKLQQSVV